MSGAGPGPDAETTPAHQRGRLPSVPRSRSAVVVFSSGSRRREARLHAALRELKAQGVEVVDMVPVTDVQRVAQWVRRPAEERPIVVAAGGDGTVGAAAGCVVHSDAVLGIIPLGTSNDVARSLSIPTSIPEAVRLVAHGKEVAVDVGQFVAPNEPPRYFVHAAAIGVSAAFARLATRRSFRRRLGPFTYVAASVIALRRARPFSCDLTWEGQRASLCLVHLSVINAPIFGGLFGLRIPGSRLNDRQLDVLAIERMPLQRLALTLFLVLFGRSQPRKGVMIFQVRHMKAHVDRPLPITVDGELACSLPGDFELAAQALRVITPHAPGITPRTPETE